MQDVGKKNQPGRWDNSPTCLFGLVGKIEVYSVAKSKSLRLGSSAMPVTVIYYHSVINKAMVFGTLQLFLIVEDNTLSKIDYNRGEARLHVSRKQR